MGAVPEHKLPTPRLYKMAVFIIFVLLLTCYNFEQSYNILVHRKKVSAIPSLSTHCKGLQSIQENEYYGRQAALSHLLLQLNASAYIAEPGANAQYYANISSATWKLSERPLLLVITPQYSDKANISILTPKFEATRAGLLSIPTSSEITYISWPEESNPYEILSSELDLSDGPIYIDGSVRHFIADGLQKAYSRSRVESAPIEITSLRSRKSTSELQIMKCANELTLEAIRHVHANMYIGMRESEASLMMQQAFSAAGLANGGCLTLFGANAALPHGAGTDRSLERTDLALFDCTANLHGYGSDVTRTVALPDSKISHKHLNIWHSVRFAQSAALLTAKQGMMTAKVDQAARSFLDALGYGEYFTHRLGHGIGLEVHEWPYLNGGSSDIIQIGHTFSDEPGVYIEGDVGVRLEDCFYIDDDGNGVYLTEGVGGQALSPWKP